MAGFCDYVLKKRVSDMVELMRIPSTCAAHEDPRALFGAFGHSSLALSWPQLAAKNTLNLVVWPAHLSMVVVVVVVARASLMDDGSHSAISFT